MSILTATLRLQFHHDFTFDDATQYIEYFNDLGISHIYASPILKARLKSTYGYDVVDSSCVNPELGGEAGLERFVAVLRKYNMRLIVDFVPNHMAIGDGYNPWWLSVMEWGKLSPFAKFFDIQWESSDPLLDGKLLLPILSVNYAEALATGALQLHYDPTEGCFYTQYHSHKMPLNPATYDQILDKTGHDILISLGRAFTTVKRSADPITKATLLRLKLTEIVNNDNLIPVIDSALAHFRVFEDMQNISPEKQFKDESFQRLHRILTEQKYRLASWKTAADEINWRRFFDINELAAIRMERHDVFEASQKKIFDLVSKNLVHGIRLDHIDGLANPRTYCRKLRRRITQIRAHSDIASREHFPIYVEKILAHKESLPDDWEIDGTTGYDFMDQISSALHDPTGAANLATLWADLSGRSPNFSDEVKQARQLILSSSFTSDFELIARGLHSIARAHLTTRDITLNAIKKVLQALIINFSVYRTYTTVCKRSEQDQRIFFQAIEGAKKDIEQNDWPLLEMMEKWLGGEPLRQVASGTLRKLRRKTLIKFQQLTSPIAAKSLEDTAGYRYGMLLSRNDVGFSYEHFFESAEDFHLHCIKRKENFPITLLTTATHDHKRGEDTRARLAIISERSTWFAKKIFYWMRISAPLKTIVDETTTITSGDEIILYQAILGSWPLILNLDNSTQKEVYLERLLKWQQKALREAKLETSWASPNEDYEQSCKHFLIGLFKNPIANELLKDIEMAANELAAPGAINSLTQTIARLTTPGVPDLYQGNEYWDFSLVDPDNRQNVDFECRVKSLSEIDVNSINGQETILASWRNGKIKQYVIAKILAYRKSTPSLFTEGNYIPLRVTGRHSEKLLAFARHRGEDYAIVILPRLISSILANTEVPMIPPKEWGNASIELPDAFNDQRFVGVFSTELIAAEAGKLFVNKILSEFPVNLLYLQKTNS